MDGNGLYDFELWKIRVKITRDSDNVARVKVDGADVGYYDGDMFIPDVYAIVRGIPSHKIDAVFYEMVCKMEESRRSNDYWMSLGYPHAIGVARWEPVTLTESHTLMF